MKTKLRVLYGVMNYALAALLLMMPFVNNIEHSILAHIIPSFAGAFLLVASLLTNYEMGILRLISFRENLVLGIIVGIVLLLSPFIFNFYIQGFIFHLVAGLSVAMLAGYVHRSIFVNRRKHIVNG